MLTIGKVTGSSQPALAPGAAKPIRQRRRSKPRPATPGDSRPPLPDPLGIESRVPALATTFTVRPFGPPSWQDNMDGSHGVIGRSNGIPAGEHLAVIYAEEPWRRQVPGTWAEPFTVEG